MKKLCFVASMLVLGVGMAVLLPGGRVTASTSIELNDRAEDVSRTNSGAFRDGLFLGKFTAERGRPRHVVSGRWATAENRALFAAGYEQGYSELVASRDATAAV